MLLIKGLGRQLTKWTVRSPCFAGGAIDEDENGSDGADVLLDLSCNKLVSLKAASVGHPRGVEDASFENTLHVLIMLTSTNSYHYTAVACQFVKAGGVGPTLFMKTTLLVGMVEDVEVL